MKNRMKYLGTALGAVLLLAGCSTTARMSSSGPGAAFDDLYATHDRQAYREAEVRQAEALKKLREQRALEDIQAAGTDGYYSENILSDSYEESYERRLRGFSSLSYNLPDSYYDLMYSDKAFQASAYDPAFYNVILMGDQVWVEPRYITSMFGSWGTSVNLNLGWGWNRWYRPYWDWYYSPSWAWNHPSWGWGYDPYWGWGGFYGSFGWGYPPYYSSGYWGWGGHSHWGDGYWGGNHGSGGRYNGRTVVSGGGRRPSLSGSPAGRYGSTSAPGGASNRRGSSTTTRPGNVYYNNGSTTSTPGGTTYRRGSSSGASYGTRDSGYSGSSSGASSNRRSPSAAPSSDSRSSGSSYSAPSSSGASSSRRSSGTSYSAPSSSGGGGGYSGGGSSSSGGGSSSRR